MSYDIVIRNGTIVDGPGGPRYRADVAVTNGKIAAIGKSTDGAKQIIDASDLIVAPGFVDPHTHYGLAADFVLFDYNTVGSAKRPEMRNNLPGGGRRLVMPAQGVQYTIVNGVVLYDEQKHSGALPGQVLRSSVR